MRRGKKYQIHLEVTYFVKVVVSADDEDLSVDELEKYLAKADDYDIVNRAEAKSYDIDKIVPYYPPKRK